MRHYRVVIALAVLAVIFCCYRAPWVQGPGTFYADAALGFAPLWTKDFRLFPDARVDWWALGTHMALAVGLVALIGWGQAIRRDG
jgi:hypothetical protein